ncbi:hypothetical protein ABPG75_005532 [Micractinium tetrahymenae]
MAAPASTVRTASAVACSSTRQAPRVQQSGAKPALPKQLKHLGAGAAGVLSTTAAGAAQAAFTQPTPFGAVSAVAELPAISVPSVSLPAVDVPDVSGLLDNPDALLVVGGATIVAAGGAALSALLGGGSSGPKAKAVPAARALEALAADEGCVLIDIRSKAEIKATGGPNLKGVSKRGAVSVPYVVVVQGEEVVDEEFGAKVAKVKGVAPEGAPVILLDSTGSESAAAAKAILAEVPLDKLYYVSGGADAWQASSGPWREPGKGLGLALPDLSSVTQTLAGGYTTVVGGVSKVAEGVAEAPEAAKGALFFAGLVGASALLFTQLELLFELAGILAAGQFLLKVVFAEDREKTLTELKKVVQEVDIPDLPQDLSKITNALLEDPTASKTEVKRAQAAAAAAVAAASTPAPVPAPAPELAPITPPAVAAASKSNGASPVEVSASSDTSL